MSTSRSAGWPGVHTWNGCVIALACLLGSGGGASAQDRREVGSPAPASVGQALYFPGRGDDWERRRPEQVGMNAARLQAAIDWANANQNQDPKDLGSWIPVMMRGEPHDEVIGPTRPRGDANGMVIRRGYIVAEWGDTRRTDMTFSVAKSYLSTTAALALDRGLIRDVHDPVRDYVRDGHFDSPHNAKIAWHHLLNQTSDWEGTLWGKPDWADRPQGEPRDWQTRARHEPGTVYKYNDVRVNVLALALLEVWRKPLPVVLRENVMDPIDASPTWRWHGYENSWVTVDGLRMQSVSGGGHWGGGFFISTRDHARFGLLFLRGGRWKGRQLVSEKWIEMATTPTPAQPVYGYMWWLNPDQQRLPSAPATSFFAAGGGGNYIYVDREHDLVVVVRWVPDLNGVVERVLAAITPEAE